MLLIVVQFNSIYVYLYSQQLAMRKPKLLSFPSRIVRVHFSLCLSVTNCLIELILPLVLKRQNFLSVCGDGGGGEGHDLSGEHYFHEICVSNLK